MGDDFSVNCGSTDEQSAAYNDILPEGECCNQRASTGIAENLDEILTLNSINKSQFMVIEEGEYISDNEYNCMPSLEPTLDLHNFFPLTSDPVNENIPHDEYIVPLDMDTVQDTSLPNVLSNEESENGLGKETDEQQLQLEDNVCNKRKQKTAPDTRQRNVRNRQRMSGNAYKTTAGKIIGDKVFKPVDNCSYRFQCTKQFPPEQQKALFEEYCGLCDSGRQKSYISSLVSEGNVKHHKKRNIDSGRVNNESHFYSMPCVSGASEICSSILSYFKQLLDTVNHIITYSDTAQDQNRNQYIAAVMYTINKLQNVETINVKFMEFGHSYLEVDSMHATTEWACHHRQVFTSKRIPISVAKKKDMPYLLRTGAMPTDYAAFIEGIPCNKGIRDLVPYREGNDEDLS
ncbi:hypothetical protein PR048_021361 [Dryococelus australis]|uniref:Uncharacterized protein n=1 Tax=Dryococelus australis TaxID=614101 RepID=A0ABQ9GY28_9NEOP|nr:hypothetical protein PR048_021361 [Dryococelus australis]